MNHISVIIPVFNPTSHLLACVDSVLHQSYENFEVIIVDDGSTNNVLASMIRMWVSPNIRVITSGDNRGVAHARNCGVRDAKGIYLSFIDQDDLWPPNKLETQAIYLDVHPIIDFVIGQQVYFLSDEQEQVPPWLRENFLQKSLPGYLPGTLMVRKKSFELNGFFDEHLRSGTDDVDWFFRAKDRGLKSAALPYDLLYKRVHGNNLSQQVNNHQRELLRVVAESIARQKKG